MRGSACQVTAEMRGKEREWRTFKNRPTRFFFFLIGSPFFGFGCFSLFCRICWILQGEDVKFFLFLSVFVLELMFMI